MTVKELVTALGEYTDETLIGIRMHGTLCDFTLNFDPDYWFPIEDVDTEVLIFEDGGMLSP